jgi:hypothetical protein
MLRREIVVRHAESKPLSTKAPRFAHDAPG